MNMEECKKVRNELAEKYQTGMVDRSTSKMSDEDFLRYVEATANYQALSGEHSIGKMGYTLKDALEERSVEFLERLAELLLRLKESPGLVGVEYFGQMACLRAIERKYGVADDEGLEEIPRKIRNLDDLVSYYRTKAIQITSEGFYPRILDYGVEHGYITEKLKKEIIEKGERFKPRKRRS